MRLRFIQRFWEEAFGERGYRALVYVVLAAFVAQGVVFLNHVHVAKSISLADAQQSGGPVKKAPLDRGDSNCPICTASAHAGVFVAANAPGVHVQLIYSHAVKPNETIAAVERFVLPWQSRAPPSV
jgi:uncharacterized protein (UPF0212 family)